MKDLWSTLGDAVSPNVRRLALRALTGQGIGPLPITVAANLLVAGAAKRRAPTTRLPSRSEARRLEPRPPPTPFERQVAQYPAGPMTYDLRQSQVMPGDRLDLSYAHPGDTVVTDGATIAFNNDGWPQVSLHKGYEDGRSAAKGGPVLMPDGPVAVDVDENARLAGKKGPFWFAGQVPNKRPWDYKQRGPRGQYEAFGNFHYGATGRGVGFPPSILLQRAGAAQGRDTNVDATFGDPGVPFLPFTGSGSYGDDPVDQYWIEQGMRYFDQSKAPASR